MTRPPAPGEPPRDDPPPLRPLRALLATALLAGAVAGELILRDRMTEYPRFRTILPFRDDFAPSVWAGLGLATAAGLGTGLLLSWSGVRDRRGVVACVSGGLAVGCTAAGPAWVDRSAGPWLGLLVEGLILALAVALLGRRQAQPPEPPRRAPHRIAGRAALAAAVGGAGLAGSILAGLSLWWGAPPASDAPLVALLLTAGAGAWCALLVSAEEVTAYVARPWRLPLLGALGLAGPAVCLAVGVGLKEATEGGDFVAVWSELWRLGVEAAGHPGKVGGILAICVTPFLLLGGARTGLLPPPGAGWSWPARAGLALVSLTVFVAGSEQMAGGFSPHARAGQAVLALVAPWGLLLGLLGAERAERWALARLAARQD